MNWYQNLFYRLYLIWLTKKKEIKISHINAVITITALTFVNLGSVIMIIMVILGPSTIRYPSDTTNLKIATVIALIFVGLLNYYFLARPQKLDQIIDHYNDEDERSIRKGRIIGWSYIIISSCFPLTLALILDWIYT